MGCHVEGIDILSKKKRGEFNFIFLLTYFFFMMNEIWSCMTMEEREETKKNKHLLFFSFSSHVSLGITKQLKTKIWNPSV